MTRSKNALFSFLTIMALISTNTPAQAQNLGILKPDQPNAIYGRIGADDDLLNLSIGYARDCGPMEFHGQLTLPTADFGDIEFSAGVRHTTLGWHHLRIPIILQLATRRADHNISTMWSIHTAATLSPGWYSTSFFIAAQFNIDLAILSHITHNQTYRDLYHSQAQDGWYHTTARTLGTGLTTGWRHHYWQIDLQAGTRTTGRFDKFIPNIHLTLGASYNF